MTLWEGDRRRHKRYTIDLYADYAFTKLWEDVAEKGIIRDISCSGMKLDACIKLNRRSHFVISVKSGDSESSDITITGKARWLKKQNIVITYGIEIRWVSDADAYKQYIEKLKEADSIY
ncbi:MAG: PilZ domain-containing protein [Candidatus Omnitrophica bacterium]|nr:PilZ domain-containing protein [Candidatus Omnitrophota bacterium]